MRKATTMLVVGVLLVALTAVIAVAAVGPVMQCDGLGDQNPKRKKCVGTDQADFITGNEYGETIKALANEDQVDAGGGNDKVYGGEDNDDIEGGTGNDTLRADDGDDTVTDQSGPDSGDPPDEDVVYLGEGVDSAFVNDGDGKDIVHCDGPTDVSSDEGDKLRNC